MVINKSTDVVPEATMEKPTEHVDEETHDDIKEEEQDKDHEVAIDEIFPERENESNSLLGESHGAQSLCGVEDMARFEGVETPTDEELQMLTGDGRGKLLEVDDWNTNVSEAEQLAELRERGVQNGDTSPLSSQNVSNQIEGEKVVPSLMGDKKIDEAESGAEMEQNVEMVNDAEKKAGEDMKEETLDRHAYSLEDGHPVGNSLEVYVSNPNSGDQVVGAQAGQTSRLPEEITISVPCENGQTEDQLAADIELPMRKDDNQNNIKADKLEHIEMRKEESEAEENAHDLAVELRSDRTLHAKRPEGQEEFHALNVGSKQNGECLSYTKCENEEERASDESAALPEEQSKSNDDLNIQNELVTENSTQQTADEVEKVLEDVQHQPTPSSELDNHARRPCDESAALLEELSEPYHDDNIQNKAITENNEQQTADKESKRAEDMPKEPCVLDPMPSNKLDNQATELHAAGEANLDGTSTEAGEELMLPSTNASREKKLVEENEKMREMVEKLMEAGKEQIAIISKLSGRVKDLEKRLARKKKLSRGCGMSMSRHPMLNGRLKA